MRKMKIMLVAAICAMLWLATAANAMVNPNFTPKHMLKEADQIMRVRLKLDAKKEKIHAEVVEMIKGKKPAKPIVIDLTMTAFDAHAKQVRNLVAKLAKGTALLSIGRDEEGEDAGFLHILCKWVRLEEPEKNPGWDMQQLDAHMEGTWNGSTDMLVRCLRYIQAVGQEDSHVPIEGGVSWRDAVQLGKATGKVTAVSSVDLLGDGKPAVHVASTGGDQLFVYDASTEKVVARKLATKSLASVWGDFNGDGRFDLASFNGKVLTLLLQKADGTFTTSATTVKIPADCRGLAVMGLGAMGKVVLVAAGNPTLMFVCDQKAGFTAVALPKAEKAVDMGAAQRPIIGDFTDDGLVDLIQPGEKAGLLYVAKADGSFATPTSCNVWCGKGGGKSWVGDFDGDGWADILVTGAERLRIFQNNRKGVFAEMRMASGEVSYKAYGTTGGGVCDFNNDGLPDIYVTQPDQQPFLYFNRGFRSFALAPIVGRELSVKLAGLGAGQQGGLFVDLDRDAAEDFVLVRTDGTIWMVANDMGGSVMAVRPHVSALAARGAPVSVKVYQDKRLLGVWQAVPGAAAPTVGVRFAAELELKYRFPGKKFQSQTVEVEEGAVDVVLKPAK